MEGRIRDILSGVRYATALVLTGLLGAMAAAAAQTPANRTVWDGVYSDDQAKRGLDVYKDRCISCHMESLDGGGVAASLVGNDFMGDWTGKSVGDLFRKTMLTMPADDPGGLKPEQLADCLAYIFSKNKFPSGQTELPNDAEALKLIRIQPQK
jgi:mono/diheme cytochrome c family protein